MNKSFTIKKNCDGVYQINELYYTDSANSYLIIGKNKKLLIDCGCGFKNIKTFLNQLNIKEILVTITHTHFDHCFGLKYFSPKNLLLTLKMTNNLPLTKLWGWHYFQPKDLTNKNLDPNKTKDDFSVFTHNNNYQIIGNEIDLGDFKLKIIKTPGHTDDSICFYEPQKKLLFSGDTIYDGEPYLNFPNTSKLQWFNSLQYLKNLNFQLLLPGHNQPLNKKSTLKQIKKWQNKLSTSK